MHQTNAEQIDFASAFRSVRICSVINLPNDIDQLIIRAELENAASQNEWLLLSILTILFDLKIPLSTHSI